jgi:hypothetical protein
MGQSAAQTVSSEDSLSGLRRLVVDSFVADTIVGPIRLDHRPTFVTPRTPTAMEMTPKEESSRPLPPLPQRRQSQSQPRQGLSQQGQDHRMTGLDSGSWTRYALCSSLVSGMTNHRR